MDIGLHHSSDSQQVEAMREQCCPMMCVEPRGDELHFAISLLVSPASQPIRASPPQWHPGRHIRQDGG